jgi:hypothetical protein
MLFGAFPIVYQQGRGWSPGIGGLAFLGVCWPFPSQLWKIFSELTTFSGRYAVRGSLRPYLRESTVHSTEQEAQWRVFLISLV